MAYSANVVEIMIASPDDVVKERQVVQDVIYEWNCINSAERHIVLLPLRWETHSAPLMGIRPQEVINKQVLERADILIGVFWTRIGTATGESISGTVEEIERHVKGGKRAMLYFSTTPLRPDNIDAKQYDELKSFRSLCEKSGLVETYDGLSEFRNKLARQLQITLNAVEKSEGQKAELFKKLESYGEDIAEIKRDLNSRTHIHVGPEAPKDPKVNDLWVDTK
jgi:hypothetical protein